MSAPDPRTTNLSTQILLATEGPPTHGPVFRFFGFSVFRFFGFYLNEASIVRLVGAVLMEANDEWRLQHRHLSIEALAEISPGDEPGKYILAPPAAAPILTPRAA